MKHRYNFRATGAAGRLLPSAGMPGHRHGRGRFGCGGHGETRRLAFV